MNVDWSRIREMYGEIGAEDFDEIAEMFLAEVSEAIDHLAAASDLTNAEADLHFIKGSALNVGFKALADLAAVWEFNVRGGRGGTIPIDAIKASFAACCDEFTRSKGDHLDAV